jgi:hypothetical protein
MVISADFEKQKQYFGQKNIALSIYCNIACFIKFYQAILLVKIARLMRA